MQIRDRIKELRRVRAGALCPNPKNWRTHGKQQRETLQGVLAEIGYADALLARELPDGRLMLIDGHLRAETTPDQAVPVLILDIDEQEADKLLALIDPIAGLAGRDEQLLADLVAGIDTESAALASFLGKLIEEGTTPLPAGNAEAKEPLVPELYQIVVECDGEEEQHALYEQWRAEGRKCRLLNL